MSKGLPRSLANAKGKHTVKVEKFKLPPTVTVTSTGAAVGFGTAQISDFPEGNILVFGALANAQFYTADGDIAATFDGDFAIGTAPTADADFGDTGEANIIASTAFGAATAGLSPALRASMVTPVMFDNTDGSLEINLNVLVDAANIADDSSAVFTVTGDVWIAYAVMGDD